MGCVLTKVPKIDERALTGLIAHFLSISRPFTISTIKITLEKKINVSSTILIFLPLNHLRHFGIFDLLGFVGAIQFSVEEIEWDAKSFKKFLKVRWGQKLIFCNFRVFESHLLKILQIFLIFCCVSLIQRIRKHTSLRL